MQKWMIAGIALMLCISTGTNAQYDYDSKVKDYIGKYKELAVAEQKRCGIPAAITLAQGIHETSAGCSELATVANNHFGIKCKKNWTGLTYSYTDDAPDECFRKYTKAENSYTDHSDYLLQNPRYASLFKCAPTDYKAWATGLKKCGYATNPKYAQVLIKIIEDYELQDFTYAALKSEKGKAPVIVKEIVPEHDPVVIPQPKAIMDASVNPPPYGAIVKINNLKAVYAKKGDMPLEYAIKNNIRYERLLEFNEIGERPLPVDMFLYLEKKNSRGQVPKHVVKEGETLAQIAQTESIQLKNLRTFNQLKEGEEPVPGAVLELQKMTFQKPAVSGEPQQNYSSKSNIRVENDIPLATNVPVPPIEESDLVPSGTTATVNEPDVTGLLAQAGDISSPIPATTAVTEIPAVYGDVAITTKDIPAPEAIVETTTQETIATGSKDIPVPEITTEAKQEEAIPTGSKDIPIPPKIYFEKTEIEAAAKTELGPPATVNEIPVKETKEVEAVPVVTAAAEAPIDKGPKSELDILKSRFDKAVYAKPVVATAPVTTSTETPIVEELKATPVVKAQVATNAPKFYTVKKGDTAFSIAKSHGITVRELRELNGLDFDAIKLGQKLKVKP